MGVGAGVRVALSVAVVFLQSCGGGGGDSPPQTDGDALLPTLSQNIEPSGARVDVSSKNYFPLSAGNSWTYDRKVNGTINGAVTRDVVSGPDASGRLTIYETENGLITPATYVLDGTGLRLIDPFGVEGFYPGIFELLPSYLEYPTPFFAASSTRQTIRQGSMKGDVDGDGKSDYFRAEITQHFVGFETLTVFGQPTEVAHFTNAISLTVVVSSTRGSATVVAVEETYFAPTLGLVRADRRATGPGGQVVIEAHTIELRSASIGGQSYPSSGVPGSPPANGSTIALAHSALVFDSTRNRFYASVPGSVVGTGNRIAIVDAATLTVTYSGLIGSDPSALGLSADGMFLYVGLNGSGEVVKLAVPSMQEVARMSLPVASFFGQLYAEDISVSPTDGNVFAVSMFRKNVSPRHGGVALVRNMVLQPQSTQDHTGSNQIEFDASGAWVYGLNTETTEFGLRRIEVLADGLIERNVITAQSDFDGSLSLADGMLFAGSAAYRAEPTLPLAGTVSSARRCVKMPAAPRVVCLSSQDSSRIVIAESVTFSLLASPQLGSAVGFSARLVPGGPGLVAVSDGASIQLVSRAELQ